MDWGLNWLARLPITFNLLHGHPWIYENDWALAICCIHHIPNPILHMKHLLFTTIFSYSTHSFCHCEYYFSVETSPTCNLLFESLITTIFWEGREPFSPHSWPPSKAVHCVKESTLFALTLEESTRCWRGETRCCDTLHSQVVLLRTWGESSCLCTKLEWDSVTRSSHVFS